MTPFHIGERGDDPLTCELLGVAWGLVWAAEFAERYGLPVPSLYDCNAAGQGTFAQAAVARGSGMCGTSQDVPGRGKKKSKWWKWKVKKPNK